MNLVERVATALRPSLVSESLGSDNQAFVVGVSGGPDSLALLHILGQVMPADRIIVAHLDHGLRPSSMTESEYVARLASGYQYYSQRIDVQKLAREGQTSLEEAGRIARYDFLAGIARAVGTTFVVAGHNADDQVETVLLHILRGSGTAGLRGMRASAPLPGHPGLWLLRPLLEISRVEIERYCAFHNLHPVLDESNMDQAFARNRLRHDLLPILEGYNPQVRQRLREMAEIIASDDDLLQRITDQAWTEAVVQSGPSTITLSRAIWDNHPLALRRRLLRRAIAEVHPTLRDLSFRALDAGRVVADSGESGSRAILPGGVVLHVSYRTLVISAEPADLATGYPQASTSDPIPLPVPGVVQLSDGWRIDSEWVDQIDEQLIRETSNGWTVYISGDSGVGLHVRPRIAGERMRQFGLGGEAKLKKIMIDRKIPVYLRDRWPVVALPDRIVWLPGHLLDERARVPTGSRRAVRLRCWSTSEGPVDAPPV